MAELLRHQGYYGSVDFNPESKCLHGKIEFIDDLVTYEADAAGDIEAAFREAVNDYIETCRQLGKPPDHPLEGRLDLHIGPELHRRAALRAYQQGMTLPEFIEQAIVERLERSGT